MGRLTVLFLLASIGVTAGDSGFDSLAGQIERAYHVKPQHIPVIGAALFKGGAARAFGGKQFRVAVFEDLPEDRPRLNPEPPGMGWQLIVRSETQPDRETVRIYARAESGRVRVLVLSEESDEITLVESSVNPAEFARHLRDNVDAAADGGSSE